MQSIRTQNVYEDPVFFAKYRRYRQQTNSYNTTVDQPAVRRAFPPLKGRTFLDIGSGFGDLCLYAAKEGATRVAGVEPSKLMLGEASKVSRDAGIQYVHSTIQAYSATDQSFDVVASTLVFHYIDSLLPIWKKVYRLLDRQGRFVFSVNHPIYTYRLGDEDSAYWDEGPRPHHWLVDNVIKYHRTLETYVGELQDVGFIIDSLREPQAERATRAEGAQEPLLRFTPISVVIACRK